MTRKVRAILSIAAIATITSGCATTGKLENSMRNARYASDVTGWLGQPTNYETDYAGRRVMHYHIDFGQTAGAYAYAPSQYGAGATAWSSPRYCDLWFTIDSSNRVVDWSYRGTNCKAK
jgi:hypothetical protein